MIRWELMSPTATKPFRNGDAAAYDLYASESLDIQPGETRKCPIGIGFQIPSGMEGQITGRSGNTLKGFKVDNGKIDPDFREPVSAMLYNASRTLWRVRTGDRIAQISFYRVEQLEDEPCTIERTNRGSGFGSSGLREPGNSG